VAATIALVQTDLKLVMRVLNDVAVGYMILGFSILPTARGCSTRD